MDHDLSEYEIHRLQNIQRNEAMLRALGFQPTIQNQPLKSEVKEAKLVKRKRNDERAAARKEVLLPTRKSPRLHIQEDDEKEKLELGSMSETDETDEEIVNYDRMPFEPNELDDAEFQIYVELKKWRLKRSRELETEPYKVFQNRTLCEFVRRKRNDANWAKPVDSESSEERKRLSEDLLMCWGVGPRKISEDGFAFELNNVYYSLDDSLRSQLYQNRPNTTN